MSRFTVANLPRMEVAALSQELLALKASDNSVAVIDVRDGDHIGGHIKGSRWVPSHQFDEWLPTLLRQLEDTKTVVFHCALSKQRGPSAALRYIREREAKFGEDSVAAPEGTGTRGQEAPAAPQAGEQQEQQQQQQQVDGAEKAVPVAQKVCVLRGGFQRWQESHGPDERLTEAYVKDLWEDY
ncbi:putative cdc25 family phosphatase ibp1 [Diaporthe ampelina]|uniref:Putative cdc25 family phosphatase ibp1 n=1 Tax=Diaporthe ampelina TaxID=1214573 RepID=A0A0G2HLN3_9PEZI|nr:putative cdc25 family phosphatase ibp1 [Diaporthe ampelina]